MSNTNQEQLIYDLIDGQLSPDQAAQAQQLVDNDPELEKLYRSLSEQREMFRRLPKFSLDDEFANRVLKEANEKKLFDSSVPSALTKSLESQSQNKVTWFAPIGAIASLAALILVALFIYPNLSQPMAASRIENAATTDASVTDPVKDSMTTKVDGKDESREATLMKRSAAGGVKAEGTFEDAIASEEGSLKLNSLDPTVAESKNEDFVQPKRGMEPGESLKQMTELAQDNTEQKTFKQRSEPAKDQLAQNVGQVGKANGVRMMPSQKEVAGSESDSEGYSAPALDAGKVVVVQMDPNQVKFVQEAFLDNGIDLKNLSMAGRGQAGMELEKGRLANSTTDFGRRLAEKEYAMMIETTPSRLNNVVADLQDGTEVLSVQLADMKRKQDQNQWDKYNEILMDNPGVRYLELEVAKNAFDEKRFRAARGGRGAGGGFGGGGGFSGVESNGVDAELADRAEGEAADIQAGASVGQIEQAELAEMNEERQSKSNFQQQLEAGGAPESISRNSNRGDQLAEQIREINRGFGLETEFGLPEPIQQYTFIFMMKDAIANPLTRPAVPAEADSAPAARIDND